VATIVDLLIAQRRLYRARSDRLKARYDFIRDFATLRVRAGRFADRDVEEVDSWMARGDRSCGAGEVRGLPADRAPLRPVARRRLPLGCVDFVSGPTLTAEASDARVQAIAG